MPLNRIRYSSMCVCVCVCSCVWDVGMWICVCLCLSVCVGGFSVLRWQPNECVFLSIFNSKLKYIIQATGFAFKSIPPWAALLLLYAERAKKKRIGQTDERKKKYNFELCVFGPKKTCTQDIIRHWLFAPLCQFVLLTQILVCVFVFAKISGSDSVVCARKATSFVNTPKLLDNDDDEDQIW